MNSREKAELLKLMAIAEDDRTEVQVARIEALEAKDDEENPGQPAKAKVIAQKAKYSSKEAAIAAGGQENVTKTVREVAFVKYSETRKSLLVCMDEAGEPVYVECVTANGPRHKNQLGVDKRRLEDKGKKAAGVAVIEQPKELVGFDKLVRGNTVRLTTLPANLITNSGNEWFVRLEEIEEVECLARSCEATELAVLTKAANTANILHAKFGLNRDQTFAALSSRVGGAKVSAASLAEAEA